MLSDKIRNFGSDVSEEVAELENNLKAKEKEIQTIISRCERVLIHFEKGSIPYETLTSIIEEYKEAI
jgi:hypothetical protein